ncbi:MAG TPA: hypothetical protein VMN57_04580, partial [Anaerolineales bacterium]|nr:hypothetical protein [Anaerolineales bacterium]
IKFALIQPIVFGLVHSQTTAGLVAAMAMHGTRFDNFKEFLNLVLGENIGVDLNTIKRKSASKTIWKEMQEFQQVRNSIVHKGDTVTDSKANEALALAEEVLNQIFPDFLRALGLEIHDGVIFRIGLRNQMSFHPSETGQ